MAVGDIAIVRYSADASGASTKPLSFVILADLSGQTIFFTDNGWQAAGGFRANEGTISYVVPANTAIGTVITLSPSSSGQFNPSTAGDQILAYTGSAASPNFLFAVDFADGNATYAGDATTSNTSAVPPGLTFGTTALAFGADNAAYNGPLTGTREEILANIADETNWVQDDAANVAAPGNFTITAAGGASVSIDDVTITEGDAGTSVATFTVTRTNADTAFSIDFATADGTASAASDYDAASGTLTFAVGGALTQTVSVTINGDTTVEPTETFAVNLSNLVQTTGSTTIADGAGTGTIISDDVSLSFIHDVQGSAFFSPILANDGITAYNVASTTEVTVRGVVTAIDTFGSVAGFYISEEEGDWDNNALTSEGIFVRTTSATAGLTVGETVTVTAKVVEFQDFTNLPRTMLVNASAIVQGNDLVALPTFIIDGSVGHKIPTAIISDDNPDFTDSDGSSGTFDPQNDALDFYETIEGMRVTMTNMIVGDGFVGGSNDNFVYFNAYSADNADPTLLNSRGGYTISGDPEFYPVDTPGTDDDVKFGGATVHDGAQHGDIIELDFGNVGRGGAAAFDQDLTMGDSLGDVSGIVDFDFGVVKFFVTDALDADKIAALDDTTPIQEVTTLAGDDRALRVASFNVENLSPVGTTFSTNNGVEITTQAKYDALAQNIAVNLQSPDILLVQEVQDNNGVGTGGTDASTTWEQLVTAVNAATGKTYQWVDEVVTGNVGGAPNGNIRVGFLYDTARVQLGNLAADATLAERRQYTDTIGDNARDAGDLIAIDDSQVAGINAADWEGTRRSVVGEFTFNGQTVYAISNHLPSKGGSGALYQLNQDNDAGQPANGGWADRNALAQDLWAVQDLISTTQSDAKLVAGGDYNEFWFNRPLEVLTGYANPNGTANTSGTKYVNLVVQELEAAERFSYDFNGRSQTLDTIIADEALAGVASYDIVHINTGYNDRTGAANPASSDHDPALASFDFRSFDETLTAAAAGQTLEGFGGNDTLRSGAGGDVLDGGAGTLDTADYSAAANGVTVTLSFGIAIGDGTDTLIGIENVTGSAFNDALRGDALDNRLFGAGGNDVLSGGEGADRLAGGAGVNTATYSSATSGVVASLANAAFNTGEATGDVYIDIQKLFGSRFADVLTGDNAANTLIGNGGADTLNGLGGDDVLVITASPMSIDGGNGNDLLLINVGSDVTVQDGAIVDIERITVLDGASLDLSAVSTGFGATVLRANSLAAGGATIRGTQGSDAIVGGMGNDVLLAGAGNDRIVGGDGDDTVGGGNGADVMIGGAGADSFRFVSLAEMSAGGTLDRIADFNGADGDRINLSLIDADPVLDGVQSFTFIGTAAFTGSGGDDYEVRVRAGANGNYAILFDVNQDGVADASFTLNSAAPLQMSDFIL